MFKFLYAVLYVITLLPLGVLHILSDIISPILYYIIRYRRKVVRRNLSLSFPEKSKRELIRIEKKFYRQFCNVFIEAIYRINMSAEEVQRRITFENIELVHKIYAEGRSAMLLTAHYGNWEWVPAINFLLPADGPLNAVYRRLHNAEFDAITYKMRLKYGGKNIEMGDLYKTMLRMSRDGEKGLFLMLGDQRPPRNSNRLSMEFLHQPTSVLVGTEVLARKFNYPVLFMSITSPKRGYYQYKLEVLSENPKDEPEFAMTEKYMRKLESDIQRQPELWLWTHKRWLHKVETTN